MIDKTKPVHILHLGSVQCAFWEKQGPHGPFYTATFRRRFQDEDGQWHNSFRFGRKDLLVLSKLADEAHSWMCVNQPAPLADSGSNGGSGAPMHSSPIVPWSSL